MKKYLVFLIFLIFTFSNFAQNAEYNISVGSNYNFFTKSSYNSEIQQTIPINSIYTSYPVSTFELDINSTGGSGFFIKNDFSFPINKIISLNTGFGISLNNSDLTTKRKSTYSNNGFILYPVFTEDSSSVYNYNSEFISKSDYNILLLNIPIQLKLKLLNEKIDLIGGLSISAVIQAKKTIAINENNYTYIATDNFENLFFSVNLGFAYNIFDNIYAGIQYDYSLTDVFKTSSDFQSYSYLQSTGKTHLNNMSLSFSYKF